VCHEGYQKISMVELTKEQKRAVKLAQRPRRTHIDIACVLHGNAYDWIYVERLHNMVQRNLDLPVTMHVWTEHDRSVPPHMVKHILDDWPGISGPKKSWWYKMQMFDPKHHAGDLLYLDLDVIVCKSLNWVLENTNNVVWTLRDFRYLYDPKSDRMNSSLLWWNVPEMSWIWDSWNAKPPRLWANQYHGDQDFLFHTLGHNRRRYYNDQLAQSWRWSAHDGGWDFKRRRSIAPGTGTKIADSTSLLVFHGRPKPHQIKDPLVKTLWR